MKILEINKFYFPQGGADKHFLDVVQLLESRGHKTAVFSMAHPRNEKSEWEKYFLSPVGYTSTYSFWEKVKGIGRMFYSIEAKRKINKILDDFQPDLVHIHNIYHQLSPIILFEIKKRNLPIVITVHDYKLVNPNYNLYLNGKIYQGCKEGKYWQCLRDKCVKNSYLKSFLAMLEMYWHNKILKTYEKNIDLYIAPSKFVKNILVQWGIDKKKIKVLPHFSFFSQTEPKNNFADTTLLYSNVVNDGRGKYGLYLGRISRAKGVDWLMNIFENMNVFQLYLAGSVEDDLNVEGRKNVKYLGFLDTKKLEEYIKNSGFIISGSRLPETFGLVALEAITAGKPFLGFKSGAYSEIIQNGFNGFLAENEKELKETIEKISRGEIKFDEEKIRQAAREKYNAKQYGATLEKIFQLLTK